MTAGTSPVPGRSRTLRRSLGLVLILTLAVGMADVLGIGFGRDPSVVRSALIGRQAPALAGRALDGSEVDMREYRGTVVLVNVWASWCPPCRREHPLLAGLQRQYGTRGLQVLGINMRDNPASARRFLERAGGAVYPSVRDPDARIAVDWGTFAVPETYVVDRDGVVVAKRVGPVTGEWIAAHVLPLVRR